MSTHPSTYATAWVVRAEPVPGVFTVMAAVIVEEASHSAHISRQLGALLPMS